ncbi:urease subunit gamma [Streptomyces murinus]|uniref:urease subunit gamma n=1 Tax=Streptomyces murinus TaxID=33900 RepID=UPI003F465E29
MPLTPTLRERLWLFTAAELARARDTRGLELVVPEGTSLITDTMCEAARHGLRLAAALERGRTVPGPDDVLPGVMDVVTEIQVEAVLRTAPVSCHHRPFRRPGRGQYGALGAVLPTLDTVDASAPVTILTVRNTAAVRGRSAPATTSSPSPATSARPTSTRHRSASRRRHGDQPHRTAPRPVHLGHRQSDHLLQCRPPSCRSSCSPSSP